MLLLRQLDTPILILGVISLHWRTAPKASSFLILTWRFNLISPLGVQIFHAGTERGGTGELKTAGGRVLSVAAYGSSFEEAVALAYEGVKGVQFHGMFYRRDIASRYETLCTVQ